MRENTTHKPRSPRAIAAVGKALLAATVLLAAAACQPIAPAPVDASGNATMSADTTPAGSAPQGLPGAVKGTLIEPTGFTRQTHDPVLAREGDTYYVFSTGARIPFLCSKDKIEWEFCGRVLDEYPPWTKEVNPNLADAWAPDISYVDGRWLLYWAASSFGSQESAIGLLTNTTLDPNNPDYAWVDQGVVLRSHTGDRWNAIDANLVLDEDGAPWLAWGSFWQGIWMRRIDPATGHFLAEDETYHHLADRSTTVQGPPAIEAPFLVRRGPYWYLFASFDQCCQGVASTYNVRVGRSETLTGPYVDRDGVPMLEGGGTRILEAYDVWKGPGHNGILIEDGVYWMPYHAYHGQLNGVPYLRLEALGWTEDGWPLLASQEE